MRMKDALPVTLMILGMVASGCGPGLDTDKVVFYDLNHIANLSFWYDAGAYFQQADGTQLLSTLMWPNWARYGYGVSLAPSPSPSPQVFFKASGSPNGHPIVEYQPNTSHSQTGVFGGQGITLDQISIFVVGRASTPAISQSLVGLCNSSANCYPYSASMMMTRYISLGAVAAGFEFVVRDNAGIATTLTGPIGDTHFHIFGAYWTASGGATSGTLDLDVDGGHYSMPSSATPSIDFASNPTNSRLDLGNGYEAQAGGAQIAEVIIFTRNLTSDEKGEVMGYLHRKYGI